MVASIDIVIPSHGRLDGLIELVAALRAGVEGANVIVVDSSTGPRAAEVKEAAQACGALYLVGPASAGAKRNIGLRAAKAEYVYFTDSDVLTCASSVRMLAEGMRRQGGTCPGVTGPTTIEYDESLAARAFSRSPSRTSAFEWPRRHPTAEWSTCTNLLVHRGLALEAGGFDETLPLPVYGEDVDFGLRLTRESPLVCIAGASVAHPGPTSIAAQFKKSLACGRMDAELQLRHPRRRVPGPLGLLMPCLLLVATAASFWLAGADRLMALALTCLALYFAGWSVLRLFSHPRPHSLEDLVSDAVVLGWDVAFEIGLLWQAIALGRPGLSVSRLGYRDLVGVTARSRRKHELALLVVAAASSAAFVWGR